MASVRTVQAGQVIYGKFPPEHRGGGSRDFTHLGFTPGFVDEPTIDAIQWYLLGETPPKPAAVARRIYKVIGEGDKGVAALGELRPAAYRDAAGRTEQYIAHFLLIRADEFEAEAGANPFYIFDQFPFVRDITQAMERITALHGPIEVSFEPRRDLGQEEALRWEGAPPGHLPALARLALGAFDLTHGSPPRGVALVGGIERREETLSGLMALLSPEDRLACSFNTEASAGVSSPEAQWQLWACGAPSRLPTHRYVSVDVEQLTVQTQTPPDAVRPGPYGEWLLAKLDGGAGVQEILDQRTQAIRAARICSGETPFDADTWNSLLPAAEEIAGLEGVRALLDRRVMDFAALHLAPHAPGMARPDRVRGLVGDVTGAKRLEMLGNPQAFAHQLLLNRLMTGGAMDLAEAGEWEALIGGLAMQERGLPSVLLAAVELRRGRDVYAEDSRPLRELRATFRERLMVVAEGPQTPKWYYRECCRWLLSTALVRPADLHLPNRASELLSIERARTLLGEAPHELVQLTLEICPQYLGNERSLTADAEALAGPDMLALYDGLSDKQKRDVVGWSRGLPESVRWALEGGGTPHNKQGSARSRGRWARWRESLPLWWKVAVLFLLLCLVGMVMYHGWDHIRSLEHDDDPTATSGVTTVLHGGPHSGGIG